MDTRGQKRPRPEDDDNFTDDDDSLVIESTSKRRRTTFSDAVTSVGAALKTAVKTVINYFLAPSPKKTMASKSSTARKSDLNARDNDNKGDRGSEEIR